MFVCLFCQKGIFGRVPLLDYDRFRLGELTQINAMGLIIHLTNLAAIFLEDSLTHLPFELFPSF